LKIVLWDIETAPLVVTSWGLFKPYLSHDNILEDMTMICASWKELDEKTIHSTAVNIADPRNDREVVEELREVLADADVLVGHNGDKYDLKIFNARLIYHGLDPLPPRKTIDTLKVAKKYFRFTSNRLDYLGGLLGVGRKIPTSYSLWMDIIMRNDEKALNRMIAYNKQDVLLLQKVYKKLRPYMTNHPNQRLCCDGEVCPICGEEDSLQKRGVRFNATTKVQTYQCQSCKGWSRGEALARTAIG
jgi:DNA polymerase elongation subunit (family B)